ncbi:MAG: rod-binding protein [Desulfobacterales bacterium]|jgi:peptidoglycan hydrolase FlgJ
MINAIATTQNAAISSNDVRQERLENACSEFESIFITYMLKSMRTAVTEDGLLGNTNESKIIRSMFDENLALGMAKGKGMGLGKMLFESLND